MKYGKLLVVLVLVLSLAACGQTQESSIPDSNMESESTISQEAENTESVSEPVSEEGSSASEETSVVEGTESSEVREEAGMSKGVRIDTESGTAFLGAYPQGRTEAEPIEWKVLDDQGNRALLLAQDCLDSLPWHNSHVGVTWDNSDIRTWLNGEFLQTAFTAEEREMILLSDLDNGDDLGYGTPVGENTQDKVFLLSGAELEEYLPTDGQRTARPTAYAISHGAYTNGSGDCAWWLRSPGVTPTSPAYLASGGSIGNRAHEVDETIIGVRPAVWVKKDAGGFSDAGSPALPIINVSEIWEKYDKDPQKYDATYDGALETATGVVTYIGQDSHGTPSMELADVEGGTSYVLGVFGSYEEMSAVSVGDTVTISGNFHIMSSENMVVLKRCEIQQLYERFDQSEKE